MTDTLLKRFLADVRTAHPETDPETLEGLWHNVGRVVSGADDNATVGTIVDKVITLNPHDGQITAAAFEMAVSLAVRMLRA